MNESHRGGTLFMLFPWKILGEKIITFFTERDYSVIVLVLSADDKEFFEDSARATLPPEKMERKLSVLEILSPAQFSWKDLPAFLSENTAGPKTVVHFLGRDFLEMKTKGNGEEWDINREEKVQVKFAFIERFLQDLMYDGNLLWVNLAYGSHKRSPDGQIWCNTRYGLTGFTRVLELTPHLSAFETLNICLSYFTRTRSPEEITHCDNCITKEHVDKGSPPIIGEDDIAAFLIHKIEESRAAT